MISPLIKIPTEGFLLQTCLFYDIETTGLSKSFDQVLHFAAIRTDLHLKELDRYELKIKLNPDVIPSPYAILTHKIGIQTMLSGVSEWDAIRQIHAWLNTPGTISLGYNTLGFDDEFLRFSFYRNLLKPYTHQYAGQCHRMDLYPMAVMFFLFKNEVITWPEKEGKISLKLEDINAANQLVSGRSHHAMVDVEVTLELARRFSKEREMWEYLHGYFKKEIDHARMQPLQNTMALCVNGKFGSKDHFQCPVLLLGNHEHYKNQTIWLRLDNPELTELTIETIAEKTWGVNKKPGEPNFMLPCKPRFLSQMDSARIKQAEKNSEWLKKNPSMLDEIKNYYVHYKYPVFPKTDIDASLYLNGFWSKEDEFFCHRFHAVDNQKKAGLLAGVSNPNLKMLALRVMGRLSPDLLSPADLDSFADYMRCVNAPDEKDTLIDYQGKKRLTPLAALREIEQIRSEKALDEADLQLLEEYEAYLRART